MDQTPYRYDVYVSASADDADWVEGWLRPRLQEAGVRVCSDADFDVGVAHLVNIERAVTGSRHTLLILSPSWVTSQWAQFEALLSQSDDLAVLQRRLLPILCEVCRPPQRIRMLSYADFTREDQWEAQLERVLAAIRGELRLPAVGPPLGGLLRSVAVPFAVPYIRNADFVGREDDLATLHSTLMGQGPVGIRPAGLTGMGGIGKSQLAIEYAYRYRDAYPSGVLWVNATEPLAQGFAQIGRKMHPEMADCPQDEQIRVATEYLRARPDMLLVLDNVHDPADLSRPVSADLIPAGLPCRLLFTTRRRDLGRFAGIEVTPLPEDPAMLLLLCHPARQSIRDPSHPEHAEARMICAMLGYLPLALEIAGTHLGRRPAAPLTAYCQELLRRGALPVLDDPRARVRPEDLSTRHDAAIAATLASQWDTLQSEEARLLLRAAGLLAESAAIPVARLGLLVNLSDQADSFFGSPLMLALHELIDTSLIEQLQDDLVRLHPLVREFAVGQMSATELAAFRRLCVSNLAAAYADIATLEDHCARRGVDALEGDLLAGLALLNSLPRHRKGVREERLHSLLRLLQREQHHLRGWDRKQSPSFFAQQIHHCGTVLGLTTIVRHTTTYLAQLHCPYLSLIWRVGQQSLELERTLAGHKGAVYAVAVTPDGRRAVSGGEDHTLKVWDLTSGQEERTLIGHEGAVMDVAVTPDGRRVVSASADRTLKMWDLDTGRIMQTIGGHANAVNAVAVTHNGRRAVSGSYYGFSESSLKVWDLETGQKILLLGDKEGSVSQVAVTSDGRWVVCTLIHGSFVAWNLQTGRREYADWRHDGGVKCGIAVVPNRRWAVFGYSNGALKVWDLETEQEVRTLQGHRRFNGPKCWVHSIAAMPDGQHIISASSDRTLKIWNLTTGLERCTLYGHAGPVNAVAVTSNGRRIISASDDSTLRVWDLDLGKERYKPSSNNQSVGSVNALVVLSDSRRVISGTSNGLLKMWDLQTGEEGWAKDARLSVQVSRMSDDVFQMYIAGVDPPSRHTRRGFFSTDHSHQGNISRIAIGPSNHYLISVLNVYGRCILQTWTLSHDRCERMHMREIYEDEVLMLVVTPKCYRVISAEHNGKLILQDFDLKLKECILKRTLRGHTHKVSAIAISSDHRSAVSASIDGTIIVWNLHTAQKIHAFKAHADVVNALALTPNGRRVISASSDRTLKIWDLEFGREIQTLHGHTDKVTVVGLTSSEQRVVSGSDDFTLKVWDMNSGRVLATVSLDSTPRCITIETTPVKSEPSQSSTNTQAVYKGGKIVVGDTAGSVYCLEYVDA